MLIQGLNVSSIFKGRKKENLNLLCLLNMNEWYKLQMLKLKNVLVCYQEKLLCTLTSISGWLTLTSMGT